MNPSSTDLQLFAAMPGNSALLLPNAPVFTIVALTDDYLVTSGMSKEALIGKGLFEAFPSAPDDVEQLSQKRLCSSLEDVLAKKKPHWLPFHRYDIPNDSGHFEERYWSATNKPVVNETGEVSYIIHSAIDVTGQVLTERKLEAIQGFEKAYAFFMAAPVIVGFIRGDNYIIELANERLLEVWGRGPEVIGQPLFSAIPELSEQGFKSLPDNVRTTGEVFSANEYPIALNRNGTLEERYFDFIYKPFYEKEGESKASGIISIGHDVTVQVLAKRRIEESEVKYRTLFETIDQGFCVLEMIFDAAGRPTDYLFLEANPVFEQQTGLKDAVGNTAKQLVPNLEQHWLEVYGKVAVTGEPIRFTEVSLAMGRWFDVYAFRVGEAAGKRVALLFFDITKRRNAEEAIRQSEANLRNMILQSPVAMAILRGPTFVVEIANERMYELWGRGKAELLGKCIFEGLPEVRDQGYEELLNGVYTTGNRFTALGIPVTLPRNKGIETVYINLLYEAFRESDGTITGVMAVATDVTEQVLATHRIEEVVMARTRELANANEELRRSNQNLEEFAYAASHDLKEPMRKIHFFSDRLRNSLEEKMTTQDKDLLERILQATKRMNRLIDDLLQYSHVSRGAVIEEVVDLNQKVEAVLEDLELEVQQKNATVTVERLPSVRANRRQMQQLFHNLITNALKYSKPEISPSITISYRPIRGSEAGYETSEEDRERLFHLIEIKDNGIGFPQEEAGRIFNVFTRLHGNAEYRGTGIGLSIVLKVVQNHRGYIWAESSPGKGSTFKILLPTD